jgi:hypothetical protein
MVIFRVTQNINIKTTDGTLVKYLKLRNPSQLLNTSLYICTFDELHRIEEVFARVGEQYKVKVLIENRITSNKAFPKELGILNKLEYSNIKNVQGKLLTTFIGKREQTPRFFLNEEFVSIEEQLESYAKQDIHLAILGNVGEHIGEMVASLTALRLLHEYLCKRFDTVVMDIYIEASDNKFYTRDKAILSSQPYLSSVSPLSVSVKKFCEYDFYIDNSSTKNRSFYQDLNYVDAYLHKFGLDFKKIPSSKKHNVLDLKTFIVKDSLKKRLQGLKKNNTLLLFHPFSAQLERSMPKEVAVKLLQDLLKKASSYTVVSVLNIGNVDHENYINLSSESKSIQDYMYIISQMDKIITTDTSTYHIADAFFIPCVVFFHKQKPAQRIPYYGLSKAIEIEDKSMNFSHFTFANDVLVLNSYESWKKIKISEVIKLLETI